VYYVRVSAYNIVGVGASQSTSPTSETPRQIPSEPTNVYLGVTSNTKLTVSFDLPTSSGGAAITQYRVQWDVSPGFNSVSLSSQVVSASTDSYYTISNLTPGQRYYVRVACGNSVGYGSFKQASPPSGVPTFDVPGKPSEIVISPGAQTLSVSWKYPRVPSHNLWCSGKVSPGRCPSGMGFDNGGVDGEADGGNQITKYVIAWDTVATFDSGSSFPHSGTADIQGHPGSSEPYSFVINSLTTGQTYYVRVLAYNNAAGNGLPCNRQADGTTKLCTGAVLSGVPT
jgi:hypothetical protein